MKTNSRLTLAFLLLTLFAAQVGGKPPSGNVATWHKNGNRESALMGTIKNGKPHGTLVLWYENGNREQISSFKNGIPHGPTILWYENGKKKFECTNYNGLLNGLCTSWYVNGTMERRLNFMLGQRHGLETRWDKDGNKTLTVKYNNGREISRVVGPDESGQQIIIPDEKKIRPGQQKQLPEDDVKPPSEQHRVFKDITLKYRMPSRCVGVENGVALLKDNDDQIKRVPIEKLSKRDQKWLRENFLEPE